MGTFYNICWSGYSSLPPEALDHGGKFLHSKGELHEAILEHLMDYAGTLKHA